MRRRAWTMLAATALVSVRAIACSTFGTADDGAPDPHGDAADDGTSSPDATRDDAANEAGKGAEAGARPCDPRTPFSAPQPVAGVNTDDQELSAHLSLDEKTIYVSGLINGLFTATRSSLSSAFGVPTKLSVLGYSSVRRASLSDDELTIFFEASNGVEQRIYSAQRLAKTSVQFGGVTLSDLKPMVARSDVDPFWAPVSQTLYFSSDRGGTANVFQIWTANVDGGVANIRALDGGSAPPLVDRYPTLSRDERALYLARNASGNDDIYVAFRDGAADPFGPALPVGEVNLASGDEHPVWYSPDGCRLYFTSDRNAAGLPPGINVWMASRNPPTQ